jgi:hypothetical protein
LQSVELMASAGSIPALRVVVQEATKARDAIAAGMRDLVSPVAP